VETFSCVPVTLDSSAHAGGVAVNGPRPLFWNGLESSGGMALTDGGDHGEKSQNHKKFLKHFLTRQNLSSTIRRIGKLYQG
jgi:hypothetical protein